MTNTSFYRPVHLTIKMKPEYYRRMSKEKLEKELLELKKQLVISYGSMEMAKVKKNEGEKARKGSDLSKRIRKEIARVNTILNENGWK